MRWLARIAAALFAVCAVLVLGLWVRYGGGEHFEEIGLQLRIQGVALLGAIQRHPPHPSLLLYPDEVGQSVVPY